MRVAHLSDLHLGHGSGAGGSCARDDVSKAFEAAMVRIGELAPELVVVSGDVFDHPRVTASPIATFAKAATWWIARRERRWPLRRG